MKRRRKPEDEVEEVSLPPAGSVQAIFTADWHLRDTVPLCRTDNFWDTQWKKVDFVAGLGLKYECPVIHAGDLFDHWKPSPLLLSYTMRYLPRSFWTVYGNHDLPQHSLELIERSGINTLRVANKARVLQGAHMGQTPDKKHALFFQNSGWSEEEPTRNHINKGEPRKVLVWHEGVWKGTAPWPGCTARQAMDVLEDFPDFDTIVTGDFHTPCIERLEGRLLVNPGSLMRQTADQIDFRPRVYLWNAEENDVVPAYLPIEPGAVSREHLDREKDKNSRLEAFVSRLDIEWEAELSFASNLKKFIKDHPDDIDQPTKDIILKAVEL